MFKAIKEFFLGKKPEAAPEAPYKVEVTPMPEPQPAPVVETVVVVPEAVVPAAVVDQTPTTEVKPVSTPKKKRTFVKRESNGGAKKAPAKKSAAKPKTKTPPV